MRTEMLLHNRNDFFPNKIMKSIPLKCSQVHLVKAPVQVVTNVFQLLIQCGCQYGLSGLLQAVILMPCETSCASLTKEEIILKLIFALKFKKNVLSDCIFKKKSLQVIHFYLSIERLMFPYRREWKEIILIITLHCFPTGITGITRMFPSEESRMDYIPALSFL